MKSAAAQSIRHAETHVALEIPARTPHRANPPPMVSPHSEDRTLKTHPLFPSGAFSENIASVVK